MRKRRAVEDPSAPIPEERMSELGGIIYLVRGTVKGSLERSLYTVALMRGRTDDLAVLNRVN